MRIKSLARILTSILGPVIFGLALWSISIELRGYDFEDVVHGIERIETGQLIQAFLLTWISYGAVSCYDLISFRYIHSELAVPKIVLAGFITYAISPTVGFPFLTAGALRYRLYSTWGISAAQVAQVILFSNLSLWVGLLPVAGLSILLTSSPIPEELDLPFDSLQPLGGICILVTVIYLLFCQLVKTPIRFWSYKFRVPSLKITLAQILTVAIDWGAASVALYSLFSFSSSFSYLEFFGVYVIGMVAGLISTVPGGLGVFETIMIFFLSPFSTNPVILGTILIFRLIYYIIPLGIAILLLGGVEIYQRLQPPEQ
jgi:hypothetical protein